MNGHKTGPPCHFYVSLMTRLTSTLKGHKQQNFLLAQYQTSSSSPPRPCSVRPNLLLLSSHWAVLPCSKALLLHLCYQCSVPFTHTCTPAPITQHSHACIYTHHGRTRSTYSHTPARPFSCHKTLTQPSHSSRIHTHLLSFPPLKHAHDTRTAQHTYTVYVHKRTAHTHVHTPPLTHTFYLPLTQAHTRAHKYRTQLVHSHT